MTEMQNAILALLKENTSWTVESSQDCISVTNDEGIDAFLFVGDSQIVAETVLFPSELVADTAALDAHILRSHRFVPLTTIGISNIDKKDYYVAFGALSTDSKDEVIIEELDTLFNNVPEFIELYSEHFTSN